jgi:two-component system, sensor histidine kinase and response regulator
VNKAPTILVVDDQPVNVRILQRKLEKEGLCVVTAGSGVEALEQIAVCKPSLVLLDVVMPEMDGMEVCKRLREMPGTEDLPVIFITAKDSRENKLAGLNAGGSDYITKPIDLDETLARVNTQLRIRDGHRKNLDLQSRLADARQAAAVGAITQGIAHNLNNLLGVVVGYVDLIKAAPDNVALVKRSTELIDKAVKRMVKIVQQLSTIATDEKPHVIKVPLDDSIESAIRRFVADYKVPAQVRVVNPKPGMTIETNIETFEDVLGRLLINAWESYPDKAPAGVRDVEIEVVPPAEDGIINLLVNDLGTGIDPEVEDHVFDPFVSGKTAVGRGMGLTVARHGIRTLGGEIRLEHRKGGGTTARVTHPMEQNQRVG